jgi:hypothetical protein
MKRSRELLLELQFQSQSGEFPMNVLPLQLVRCDKGKVHDMPRKCEKESLPLDDEHVRGKKRLSQVLKYVMRYS